MRLWHKAVAKKAHDPAACRGWSDAVSIYLITANRGWIVAFRMPPCHGCDNDQDSVKSSGAMRRRLRIPPRTLPRAGSRHTLWPRVPWSLQAILSAFESHTTTHWSGAVVQPAAVRGSTGTGAT